MSKPMTPTQLRANLYRVIDEVVESGVSQEIVRGDRRLALVALGAPTRNLTHMPRRTILNCTVDELIATTWEFEPDPDDPLPDP